MGKRIHKILFFNHSGQISGAEISLLSLLTGLNSEVKTLLVCPKDGPLLDRASELRVCVEEVESFESGFTQNPLNLADYLVTLLRIARKITTIAKRQQVDLVHANSVRAGLVACVSHLLHKVPVVVHVRDCVPENLTGALIRRVTGGLATRIITNSNYVAHHFALNGSMLKKTKVVYNAVNLDRFDPKTVDCSAITNEFSLGGHHPILAIVGQISPWKGHLNLIEAMPDVLQEFRSAKLLIVGEAKFTGPTARYNNIEYKRKLRSLVRNSRMEGHVIFTGERSDIPQIMKAIDILLLPSWEEPFGRTLIEAMAMEKPVVATKVGGPAEIIEKGVTGLLIPPKNPKAITKAVIRLASNPEMCREMGKIGRKTVLARFNLDSHVASVLEVYQKALT